VVAFSEHMTDALRMVELRFTVAAIHQSYLAVADLVFESHRVFVDYHKAVIASIRDNNEVSVQV
jgi:hypothetical protein